MSSPGPCQRVCMTPAMKPRLGPYKEEMRPPSDIRSIKRELKLHALVIFGFVGLIWLIEIVDLTVFNGGLDGLGIRPRTAGGLTGILLSPFLHAGFGHLLSNTLPFIVLGWLVLLRETWHFFVVSAVVILVGGLGVWLFGRPMSVHVGASGLIFGLFGYLLLAGWFDRRISTILLSLFVAITYGTMIFGVLPTNGFISWEGHLFGFLAGALTARLLARPAKDRAKVT